MSIQNNIIWQVEHDNMKSSQAQALTWLQMIQVDQYVYLNERNYSF
jgi:hypothetical protein